jgi:hypothetical protein
VLSLRSAIMGVIDSIRVPFPADNALSLIQARQPTITPGSRTLRDWWFSRRSG